MKLLLTMVLALAGFYAAAQETPTCVWEFPTAVTISETTQPDYWVKIGCTCIIRKAEVTVFNRWGEVIYTTDKLEHTWMGKNSAEGMYLIRVKGTFSDGTEFTENRSIAYYR